MVTVMATWDENIYCLLIFKSYGLGQALLSYQMGSNAHLLVRSRQLLVLAVIRLPGAKCCQVELDEMFQKDNSKIIKCPKKKSWTLIAQLIETRRVSKSTNAVYKIDWNELPHMLLVITRVCVNIYIYRPHKYMYEDFYLWHMYVYGYLIV